MRHTWRPMTPADLPAVMAIADIVHAGYFEAQAVFAERLALFPAGCWIAHALDSETAIGGYLFAHPARLGHPPALNTLLHGFAHDASCLHLHDIALLDTTRGAGLGTAAVDILRQLMQAQGLVRASLVAVHDSAPYWQRFGFDAHTVASENSLESYGDGARYMSTATLKVRDSHYSRNQP